jgi:small basic protein (TIGR04137 family)
MTLHRSLRSANEMARHRNVLSRVERIEKLQEEKRWDPENDSILGLPKVRSMKVVSKKKKKKDAEAGETAEAAPAAEG